MKRMSVCLDCGKKFESPKKYGPLRSRCLKHRATHITESKATWYAGGRKTNAVWQEENKRRAKAWRQKNKQWIVEYNNTLRPFLERI